MNDVLEHHGILGMKWGVRRTPAQLGHTTGGKTSKGSSEKEPSKPAKSAKPKKTSAMTDEELRDRINRLQMEEQYSSLLKRQKESSRGTVSKLLREAGENLGRQSLNKVVSSMVDKVFGDKDKTIDVEKYKDADVMTLDAETLSAVSKWWENASKITANRKKLQSSNDSESQKGSSNKKTEDSFDKMAKEQRKAIKRLGR